jgi:hypothetical protein
MPSRKRPGGLRIGAIPRSVVSIEYLFLETRHEVRYSPSTGKEEASRRGPLNKSFYIIDETFSGSLTRILPDAK